MITLFTGYDEEDKKKAQESLAAEEEAERAKESGAPDDRSTSSGLGFFSRMRDAVTRTRENFSTRINDIENGGGLNKTYKLDYGSTVTDDAAVDQLFGGTPSPNPDDDWFFQGVAAAAGADQVNNLESGETVTTA